jgi:hypothetical protein
MRRSLILLSVALIASPLLVTSADAQRRFGGGIRVGGFHGGGGFARAGLVRPGWNGGGTRWAGGWNRGWGGGGFVRPGWNGGGVRWAGGGWGPGWNGGWGWRRPGWGWAAAGVGLATAAAFTTPYWGYDPYYSYASDGCRQPRRVWTGWGYQVRWVNVCGW